MARTTLSIDDNLLRQAKKAAAETHRSLAQFVEDAVREVIARRKGPVRRKIKLPTSPGGPRPGVDLDRTADLIDAMDGT